MPPFIPARPRRQAEAAGQLPPPSLASLRIEVTASQPKLKSKAYGDEERLHATQMRGALSPVDVAVVKSIAMFETSEARRG